MTAVDWDHPILKPAPRKNRPQQRETFYRVTCDCGSVRELRKADAIRATMCRTCQHKLAGKAGYKAAVQKHGPDGLLDKVAAFHRDHPTRPERIVRDWLIAAGITHETQVVFKHRTFRYIVDFVVADRAVEVVGYWHRRRKGIKDETLRCRWPGQVLFLDDDFILGAPDLARAQLLQFIGGYDEHAH